MKHADLQVATLLLGTLCLASPAAAEPIVIGSKNFAENRLLGEMFAQLIEQRTGLAVDRRLGLAGTQVCFDAVRSGAIDLYPEYTGTGLVSILRLPPAGDAARTLTQVRKGFRRYDLVWLAPLGFENSYEIAVPAELARRHSLRTISDLVPLAPELTAGFGYEFAQRPDGLPGLERVYGLSFAEVVTMQQALKVRAAAEGRVQVLDVYTTDGRILKWNLQVLRDDRDFFPPYQAAPLARRQTLAEHPEIALALSELAGLLDAERMRGYNRALQDGGASEQQIAHRALREIGLLEEVGSPAERRPEEGGRWRRLFAPGPLLRRLGEHLALTGLALGLGVGLAVPLGVVLERRRPLAEPLIRAVGVTQTIPSIALLAFMIPLFGVGFLPAVVALWLYSLFPILRNTYTGIRDADPEAAEAALALGMTPVQVLVRVRLPLAAPVILAGVRTAAVLTVGTATLAAFIGAGGLGEPIVTGLQLADTARILSGAIPAAALAIVTDLALAGVERLVAPRGVVA